jgi:hypothetical protein
MNAVAKLTELGDAALREAASASSDYRVLLRALENPEVAAVLRRDDPLAAARLRGQEVRWQLLEKSGGVLGAEEVGQVLGLTRQAVDKRRRAGRLIGLSLGRRGYAYPAFQFREGRTLPNLERVLEALRDHDPWMQVAFFLSGNGALGGKTPLNILQQGAWSAVVAAARRYGEQGAA